MRFNLTCRARARNLFSAAIISIAAPDHFYRWPLTACVLLRHIALLKPPPDALTLLAAETVVNIYRRGAVSPERNTEREELARSYNNFRERRKFEEKKSHSRARARRSRPLIYDAIILQSSLDHTAYTTCIWARGRRDRGFAIFEKPFLTSARARV